MLSSFAFHHRDLQYRTCPILRTLGRNGAVIEVQAAARFSPSAPAHSGALFDSDHNAAQELISASSSPLSCDGLSMSRAVSDGSCYAECGCSSPVAAMSSDGLYSPVSRASLRPRESSPSFQPVPAGWSADSSSSPPSPFVPAERLPQSPSSSASSDSWSCACEPMCGKHVLCRHQCGSCQASAYNPAEPVFVGGRLRLTRNSRRRHERNRALHRGGRFCTEACPGGSKRQLRPYTRARQWDGISSRQSYPPPAFVAVKAAAPSVLVDDDGNCSDAPLVWSPSSFDAASSPSSVSSTAWSVAPSPRRDHAVARLTAAASLSPPPALRADNSRTISTAFATAAAPVYPTQLGALRMEPLYLPPAYFDAPLSPSALIESSGVTDSLTWAPQLGLLSPLFDA